MQIYMNVNVCEAVEWRKKDLPSVAMQMGVSISAV